MKSKFESKVNPNNPAAIGKFLQPNYTSSKPADAHLCSKGIEELKAVLDELEEKNEELKSVRSSLFVNNAIKAGMTEKNEFLLEAIAQVENEKIRISEAVTSMTKSLEMLRETTKGLPIKKIGDSKKKRKNGKKNARQKKARLERRISVILTKLKAEDGDVKIARVDNDFWTSLHKLHDKAPIAELVRRNFFIGDAVQKAKSFLMEASSESDSDTD